MWTNDSSREAQNGAMQDMAAWMVCPDTVSGIQTFARVSTDPNARENSRRAKLIHHNPVPGSGGPRAGVSFRVQGFIEQMTLGPTGNYDG